MDAANRALFPDEVHHCRYESERSASFSPCRLDAEKSAAHGSALILVELHYWLFIAWRLAPGITETEFCSWKFSTVSGFKSICWPLVAAETPVPAPAPAAAPMAAPFPPPKTPPRIAPRAAPPPTLAAVDLPRALPCFDH